MAKKKKQRRKRTKVGMSLLKFGIGFGILKTVLPNTTTELVALNPGSALKNLGTEAPNIIKVPSVRNALATGIVSLVLLRAAKSFIGRDNPSITFGNRKVTLL